MPPDVVVRTDDQVVVRIRVVLVMLGEIIDGGSWSSVVIPGCCKNRDLDPREFVLVGNHIPPVGVVARMPDPSVENRIWCSVDLLQVTIGPAAHVPVAVQSIPSRSIVPGCIVEVLRIRGIERVRVNEIPENVSF